jgi:lysozyme family protein
LCWTTTYPCALILSDPPRSPGTFQINQNSEVAMTIDDTRFAACLPYTLKEECPCSEDWSNSRNFSNDAHDPGGETMVGVIQREYDGYRRSCGEPVQDVRKLSQDEGEYIYRHNYWLPHCPNLPAGLDLAFFDSAVNEGATEAIRILQVALAIENDGDWGDQTSAAVAQIQDVPGTIKAFTARREAVYRSLRGFQYFGRDWLERSARIQAAALAMAAGAVA